MAIVRYKLDPNKPPHMSAEELSRFTALRDEDIDTSDIPVLDDEVWRGARGRVAESHNQDYAKNYHFLQVGIFPPKLKVVRMRRIRSHDRRSIQTCARSLIDRATRVHTDSPPAYRGIGSDHRRVTHSHGDFARIDLDLVPIHVNSAEAVHAELRRVVIGIYHHLSRNLRLQVLMRRYDERTPTLSDVSWHRRGRMGTRESAPDPRLTNPYWKTKPKVRSEAEGDKFGTCVAVGT